MKIHLAEVANKENAGSPGAKYVENSIVDFHAKRVSAFSKSECDVLLLSVHHCRDFLLLPDIKARGKIVIVGGHPMASNFKPVVPFADYVCVGEGETWIQNALQQIKNTGKINHELLAGTFSRNANNTPVTAAEENVPDHPPYLNRAATGHAKTWYIEVARGCPHSCHYCELGWSQPYRKRDPKQVLRAIEQIDKSLSRRVTLFCPDEASIPEYPEYLEAIKKRGLLTGFGSMRLDVIEKRTGRLSMPRNMLIRVGIDGMTEETRFRVNKRIRDGQIVKYFETMTQRGIRKFKMFMIFSYPWDTVEDFEKFKKLLTRITRIRTDANIHLRIKWTPFIPQPGTPLENETPHYNHDIAFEIQQWHDAVRFPKHEPGWFIENDGMMGARRHELECRLASGNENVILEMTEEERKRWIKN